MRKNNSWCLIPEKDVEKDDLSGIKCSECAQALVCTAFKCLRCDDFILCNQCGNDPNMLFLDSVHDSQHPVVRFHQLSDLPQDKHCHTQSTQTDLVSTRAVETQISQQAIDPSVSRTYQIPSSRLSSIVGAKPLPASVIRKR
ncbi:hypothetical protein Ciccas_005214 [Cichlidogyrus casuarinus]|uniref:ZZ-type domain-containing protein n=1 Tax=Cichlidogyrus casuarinus TaxID=1844966 RepID=A0ABD2QA88_9PLAT